MSPLNMYGTTYTENDVTLLLNYGMGLEIEQYMTPKGMDSFDSQRSTVNNYIKNASKVSMHGIFYDMNFTSSDNMILDVAEKRFSMSCEIALMHNIDRIVFHSSDTKYEIRNPEAADRWVKDSAAFWTKFCRQHDDIMVLLENNYDQSPDIFLRMLDETEVKNIGCCFDIGHVYVNSQFPLSEWIRTLGTRIKHVHLHDNKGFQDEHSVLGTGTIPLRQTLAQLIDVVEEDTPFVLECDKVLSIAWLKKEGFI